MTDKETIMAAAKPIFRAIFWRGYILGALSAVAVIAVYYFST